MASPPPTTRVPGGSDLGKALAEVARVIRGNVGVEVLTVDQGDWDMHTNLGEPPQWGQMIQNAGDLATSVAAFFGDLGDQARQGHAGRPQRVRPAGGSRTTTEGLDHGYGNVCSWPGAGVKGGKYYGHLAAVGCF